MAGTGLPIPKTGGVFSNAPSINADALSSADAWTRIAASGAKIASAGLDLHEKDVHLQQAGAIADFEERWRKENIESRDKFQKDPDGFKNWAESTIDGAVGEVPSWMAPHAKKYLSRTFDGSYSAILGERRSQDNQNAATALVARRQSADDDVMALASGGKIGTNEWNAAVAVHQSVMDTAVSAGEMPQEQADYLRDNLVGRAQGEVVKHDALLDYQTHGYEAAVTNLRKNVLENEKLSLKPSQREKIFSTALTAIRLQKQVDREDRVGIVQEADDVIAGLKAGLPVDESRYKATLDAAARVGAHAKHRELSVEYGVQQYKGLPGPMRGDAVVQGRELLAQRAAGPNVRLEGVNPDFGGRLAQAISDAEAATGQRAKINSLKRSTEEQAEIYARSGQGTKFLAAPPGHSRHETGDAADIQPGPVLDWLHKNAGKYGLSFLQGDAFRRDPVHIQLARSGDGAPAPTALPGNLASQPYGAEVFRRVQANFVADQRKLWPDAQRRILAGQEIDTDDYNTIRQAAALSGDEKFQREVEEAGAIRGLGQKMAELPIGQQQSFVDQAQSAFNERVAGALKRQLDKRDRMLREDQVSFAVDAGRDPPAPMDLSSPQAAVAVTQQRVNIARAVASEQGIPPSIPFRKPEVSTIAGAIAGANKDVAASGYEALASLPDEFIRPTLGATEIKTAITGAARSPDPVRFTAAMQFVDRIYQRAPEEVAHLFGDDTMKQLQDWQAKLRYYSPQELAEQLKMRDDPQVMARHKANIEAGQKIAREKKPESIISEWSGLLGFGGPGVPTDPRTRDAWMADYTTLFGERYAVSLDKELAHKQAVERMKPYWKVSDVNGGRLTLYPPETVYQPVNGSYGWMKEQIEKDLTVNGTKPSDYMLIADSTTERDVSARRPASYIVSVKGPNGEWDVVRDQSFRPRRYAWDNSQVKADAREEFKRQRDEYFKPLDQSLVGLPQGY